jgi:hypothetical protein
MTISTTAFLNGERPIQRPNLITRALKQIETLAQEQPLISLTTSIVFGILGIGTLISAPFVSANIAAMTFAATGGASLIFSGTFAISLLKEYSYIFSAFSPERISADTCAFETKACDGGSLKYINEVPVLKITTLDPEKRGYAQGYLTGKNIHQLMHKFLRPFAPYLFTNLNAYKNLLQKTKQVKFSAEEEKEIHGIVNGYNQWRKEEDKKNSLVIASRLLTIEDVKAWRAFPDLLTQGLGPKKPYIGGSTVVCRKNGETYVGSNFDFNSKNILGEHTLVTVYPSHSRKVATIGFAGGIAIRGMNDQGLCTVVNDAGITFKSNEFSYCSLQRQVLENSNTTQEAKNYLNSTAPSCSHLLTLADQHEACIFQWYPDKHSKKTEKSLNMDQFTVATNHFEDQYQQIIQDSLRDQSSVTHAKILHDYLKSQLSSALSVADMLHQALKAVEEDSTLLTLVMSPNRKEILLNWDNCYSADLPLQKLTYNDLFN